jgi:hypothetical protein
MAPQLLLIGTYARQPKQRGPQIGFETDRRRKSASERHLRAVGKGRLDMFNRTDSVSYPCRRLAERASLGPVLR